MAFNIGNKILTMILLSIAITASSMLGIAYLYNNMTHENIQIMTNSHAASLAFKDFQLKLQQYKANKDTKLMIGSKESAEIFITNLNNKITRINMLGNQELISLSMDILKNANEIQQNIKTLSKSYNELSYTKLEQAVKEIEPKFNTLISDEDKNFDNETKNIRLYLFAAIILVTITIGGFSFRISQSVISPINKLISASLSSSKGDLTQTIKITSKDEMGALAGAFNSLTENLSKAVKQLRNTSELISKYAGEYASASEDLNSSSINIASSVQGIARGAYIQAKQVEKTSQIIENMVTSVTRVAQRAQTQAEKTSVANEIAQTGSTATNDAINKMNQINVSVTNTAVMSRRLKERSTHIGQIVEAITKIAEQTNLLAINTAIEAARAGDGAREFRVIADEVRKLAEASGKAADQIIKLLKEIQTETNSVISASEVSAKDVNEGVKFVNNSAKSIEDVSKAMTEVNNLAVEISKNTQEQSTGFEQVRKSISTIASVSEENARSTDDVLNSSQNQTKLTKTIIETSAELKKLSTELIDLVKQFKV